MQLLIDMLQNNPKICQVCLQRNPWYDHEFNIPLIEDDKIKIYLDKAKIFF
jgi:hypothetical protein